VNKDSLYDPYLIEKSPESYKLVVFLLVRKKIRLRMFSKLNHQKELLKPKLKKNRLLEGPPEMEMQEIG
jgi:hypothetical protein